jgi:hypothetical protein
MTPKSFIPSWETAYLIAYWAAPYGIYGNWLVSTRGSCEAHYFGGDLMAVHFRQGVIEDHVRGY